MNKTDPNTLFQFVDYGRLDAPLWFIGMEEGTGGKTDDIAANIHVRAQHFNPVMDLFEGQLALGYDLRVASKSPTPVWIWIAKIVRGIEGAADWADAPLASDYVRQRLGRKDGSTLLTELLPLPAANSAARLYADLYPSREAYVQNVLPKRQTLLKELIREHTPRYVFAYGSANRHTYKTLFESPEWQHLPPRGRIEFANWGISQIALLPFLGNGAVGHADITVLLDALKN